MGRSWFERGEVAARNWLLGWAKSEPPNNARLGAVNVTWQSRTESHRVAPRRTHSGMHAWPPRQELFWG